MSRLRGEYVYAHTGPMRPVFLLPQCAQVRFCLRTHAGDEARVLVSHDPREALVKGRAKWLPYDEEGGGVHGATALRVRIDRLDGWVSLVVEQEMHDDGK